MKNRRIIIALLFSTLIILSACTCSDNESSNISASETSADTTNSVSKAENSIKYKIDKKTRTLYINGTGSVYQQQWVKHNSDGNIISAVPIKIVIGRGATLLGDYVFDDGTDGNSGEGRNCLHKVKEVKIPDTVTQIGREAFTNLSSLKSINIPDSVTLIGEAAFTGCTSLETVKLPSKLEEISPETFYYCKNLKSIKIPKSVKTIGSDAFMYCDDLTIKGYKGTAAEKYANKYKFKFIALDK